MKHISSLHTLGPPSKIYYWNLIQKNQIYSWQSYVSRTEYPVLKPMSRSPHRQLHHREPDSLQESSSCPQQLTQPPHTPDPTWRLPLIQLDHLRAPPFPDPSRRHFLAPASQPPQRSVRRGPSASLVFGLRSTIFGLRLHRTKEGQSPCPTPYTKAVTQLQTSPYTHPSLQPPPEE